MPQPEQPPARRTLTMPPMPPGPVPGFGPAEPVLQATGLGAFADLVRAGLGHAAGQVAEDVLPYVEDPRMQLIGTGLITGGSVAPPALGLPGIGLGTAIKGLGLAGPAIREGLREMGRAPQAARVAEHAGGWTAPPVWAPEGAPVARDFMSGQEQRAVIGFDPRLALTLSQNLYQGNVGDITLKELVQNATDALRAAGGPSAKMEVWTNPETRQIRVLDTGTGMSPDTVMKEFVQIGGSLKGAEAAGGFGVAKAVILSNAEKINMRTTWMDPAGQPVTTMVEGSGADWLDPARGLRVRSYYDKLAPLGTDIEITVKPEAQFGSPLEAVVSPLQAYGDLPFPVTAYKFDQYAGTYQPYEGSWYDRPKKGAADAPWVTMGEMALPENAGTLVIQGRGPEQEVNSLYPRVLNQGIPQFSDSQYWSSPMKFPEQVRYNVKATVSPEREGYPFTTNREQLRYPVQQQIKAFLKDYGMQGIKRDNEALTEVVRTAPEIMGTGVKFYDVDRRLTAAQAQALTGPGSYLSPLAQRVNQVGQDLLAQVGRVQGYGTDVQFALGYSTDAFGMNINLSHGLGPDAPKRELIVMNPYATAVYVDNLVSLGTISHDEAAEMFSSSLTATLLHEIAHVGARGHDQDFASQLTRGIGAAGKSLAAAMETMGGATQGGGTFRTFYERLLADNEQFRKAPTGGASVFGKAGTEYPATVQPARPQKAAGRDDRERRGRP